MVPYTVHRLYIHSYTEPTFSSKSLPPSPYFTYIGKDGIKKFQRYRVDPCSSQCGCSISDTNMKWLNIFISTMKQQLQNF